MIPADRKWFARIAAAAVIAHTLMELDPRFPAVGRDALAELTEEKKALEAEAPEGAAPDPNEAEEV